MAQERKVVLQAIKLPNSKIVHGFRTAHTGGRRGFAACSGYGQYKPYALVKEGPEAEALITCKRCRKALYLTPLPEPTTGVKKLRGTCGCCGGSFRVKAADAPMSAHGFKISAGWNQYLGYRDGKCIGQHQLPIEVSAITLDILIAALTPVLVSRKNQLKILNGRPQILTVHYKDYDRNARVRGEAKTYTLRATGEDDGPSPSGFRATYDDKLRSELQTCQWEIEQVSQDLADAKYDLKYWAPSDLTVEVVR